MFTRLRKKCVPFSRNNLSVNPSYTFENCLPPDILLIPGGFGTRREMNNSAVLDWIKHLAQNTEHLLSVCTGSLVLAKAGLLDGLAATTHHGALSLLQEIAPKTTIDATKRFIDNGEIIVSAGVSAGIDMSLHVVAKLLGKEQAWETARYIEYDWRPEV